MRFLAVPLTCLILLVLTGCENQAVVDSIEVDQLTKPIIINDEPEHLAREFDEIMMDLSHMTVPDSAKLVKAWTLAFELAKYDGPMAEVFESLGAAARGDSIWSSVKDRRLVKPVLAGKTTTCEERCREDWLQTALDIGQDAHAKAIGCGAGAATAMFFTAGTLTPAIAVGMGFCFLGVAWDYWRDNSRNDRDLDTCVTRCQEDGG